MNLPSLGIQSTLLLALCLAVQAGSPGEPLPTEVVKGLKNIDFREGLKGWTVFPEPADVKAEAGVPFVTLSQGQTLSRVDRVPRGFGNADDGQVMVSVDVRSRKGGLLFLRLRQGGPYRDRMMTAGPTWQTIRVMMPTPTRYPGLDQTSLSIQLSNKSAEDMDLRDVQITLLPRYGVYIRVQILEGDASHYQAGMTVIRRHRNKNSPDSIQHRFSSHAEIVSASPGLKTGQSSGWIDLRPHLFGKSQSTGILQVTPTGKQKVYGSVKVLVELASYAQAPAQEATIDDFDFDSGLDIDIDFDEPQAADAALATATAYRFASYRLQSDEGRFLFLLPENELPPAQFAAGAVNLADQVAERSKKLVKALGPMDRLPAKIPVAANFSFRPDLISNELAAKEIDVLACIGLSSTSRSIELSSAQKYFDAARGRAGIKVFHDKLYLRLGNEAAPYRNDPVGLRTWYAKRVRDTAEKMRKQGTLKHVAAVELTDEPGNMSVTSADLTGFRRYCTEKQLSPLFFGVDSLAELRPWGVEEKKANPTPIQIPTLDDSGKMDELLGALSEVEGTNITEKSLGLEEDVEDAPAVPDLLDPTISESANPDAPLPDRRLYYWTRRYAAWKTASFYRAATEAVQAEMPGVDTLVNFRSGVRRVLTSETADWFLFGRMQAVTCLWNEDWLNCYGWRRNGLQLVSYYTELMRTAARPHKLAQGGFLIQLGTDDGQRKAMSALAHGSRSISFWRYGPAYLDTLPYCWSGSDQTVNGIATFCRDVAAVEDDLMASERVPEKVALLYAKSDPLWGYNQTENRLVYLAFLHEQIPCTLVTEAEIEEDGILDQYTHLAITDRTVRKETLQKVAKWGKTGGRLWLSGEAATRDEYNEPCDVLAVDIGITGRRNDNGDAALTGTLGKGGWCVVPGAPGVAYEQTVTRKRGKIQTGWSMAARQRITQYFLKTGVICPIKVSRPGLESTLYQGEAADLLFLVDFSGLELGVPVKIRLTQGKGLDRINSQRHGDLAFEREGDSVTFSWQTCPADILRLVYK